MSRSIKGETLKKLANEPTQLPCVHEDAAEVILMDYRESLKRPCSLRSPPLAALGSAHTEAHASLLVDKGLRGEGNPAESQHQAQGPGKAIWALRSSPASEDCSHSGDLRQDQQKSHPAEPIIFAHRIMSKYDCYCLKPLNFGMVGYRAKANTM